MELAGVDAAAAGFDANGVLEVKHLVVEEVLDSTARRVGAVEDAADDDGVVGRIVVAEHASGVVGGPSERGAAQETMKEAGVERLEDFVEIVVVARRRGETFAAAGLADMLGLFGDGLAGDVTAIAVGVDTGDGFLVELGEEYVGDGVMNGFGRWFE